MADSEAWKQGYEAFRAGNVIAHNPYDSGTEQHSDWVSGWEARLLHEMY